MFRKVAKKAVIGISLISVLSFTSCSTTTKLIKHGKLEVETKMSDTVFLEPIADNKKTVLLQIKNTTDKSGLDIESKLKTAVQSKGYRIVTSPDAANIMIQANILQVGKNNLEDPFQILTSGYGSGLAGFTTGATLGGALGRTGRSMLGTGLLFGASETILDAAVEVVTFTMITDLQISERRSPAQQNASGKFIDESSDANLKQGTSGMKKSTWKEKNNWKKYQTRIMSLARKTNLKFEQAEPELVSGLVSSIAGIL
jgi:hypothetical protein